MGIFKKIIGLFKKSPPVPRWQYSSTRDIMRVEPLTNRQIQQLRYDYAQRIPSNEDMIRIQNYIQQLLNAQSLTQEQIRHIREYYSNISHYSPYLKDTRKRIPVNKEIDPFEEEIWYEDETKTN